MSKKAEATFVKPLIAGGLAGGYAYFSYGFGSVSLFGTQVPTWVMLGGTVAAAALLGEIEGNYVLPFVVKSTNGNPEVARLVTAGLNPVLCGGSAVLASKFLAPDLLNSVKATPLILMGAASYIGANYLSSSVLKTLY